MSWKPILGLLTGLPVSVSLLLAGTPPPGFVESTIDATTPQISAFDWAPSGDLFILSKLGAVNVLRAGTSVPITLGTLSVNAIDDGGVLGLAFDPGFAANARIYIYYTVPTTPAHNRVSRFTVSGNALIDETILLELPDLVKTFHYAGHLRFDASGCLLISVGDNGAPSAAQDKGSLLGKILRINPDGSIPSDNPFVGDPQARHEIWALGLRNPWRFSIQPGTGTLFIGDVGDGAWEELDLGIPGANYGYPLVEGPAPPGVVGMTYPVYAYPHAGQSAAITGGEQMTAGNFPAQYEGEYFFGDSSRGTISRMTLDANNAPVSVATFLTGADRPIHIRTGPDGALWYASIFPSALRRVAWVGGTNSQPNPVADITPSSGSAPLTPTFDALDSSDPDGDPLTFTWTFGDGGFQSGAVVQHTYANPGVFNARLITSDGHTQIDLFTRVVSGNRAPTPAILSPSGGATFMAGDTISFSGSGSDAEEGALPASGLSWSVLFHHNTHTHPHLGPVEGIASGSFQIPVTGEPDPDVWYELILTASDTGAPLGSAGVLSRSTSMAILPVPGSLRLESSPVQGLGLLLDGHPVVSPLDVPGVAGYQREVAAVSPQTPGDGHTYTFSGWSDAGGATHTVALTPAGSTLTARYLCDVIQEVADIQALRDAGGNLVLTWPAVSDPCLATGTRYRVWMGSTPRPSGAQASFPANPAFSIAGETAATSLTLPMPPGPAFFVVEALGSDGNPGPLGHYGQ